MRRRRPYLDPLDPQNDLSVRCQCGEDVFPGEECRECGEYCHTDAEMREEAEIAKAEAIAEERGHW